MVAANDRRAQCRCAKYKISPQPRASKQAKKVTLCARVQTLSLEQAGRRPQIKANCGAQTFAGQRNRLKWFAATKRAVLCFATRARSKLTRANETHRWRYSNFANVRLRILFALGLSRCCCDNSNNNNNGSMSSCSRVCARLGAASLSRCKSLICLLVVRCLLLMQNKARTERARDLILHLV